jgi:tetratricopeptide (TPR) repeat protein
VALSQKNDQDGAIAEYREAIRLNPKNQGAHINLGNRLGFKGDWDGATAEYSEAVRLNSNSSAAHYLLGTAYEHKNNSQAALQEYRTASELAPQNPTYQKAFQRLNATGNL